MSQFSSTLQILKVENEERTSQRTKNTYNHFAARCIVLDDSGEVITVGVINSRLVTKELRDQVKPGVFRAGFTLQVPDFGDSKGDIVAVLTSLTPAPLRALGVGAAASAPAPVAAQK